MSEHFFVESFPLVPGTDDPIQAWRQWRRAEAAYNRVANKLDDWTPEISEEFRRAERAKNEAWKLAARLLDAASLPEDSPMVPERDRPAAPRESEVTSAMIAAGISALSPNEVLPFERVDQVVIRIYCAMKAISQNGGPSALCQCSLAEGPPFAGHSMTSPSSQASVSRISFQTDMTSPAALEIPLGFMLEAVWPDQARWLGLIGRPRLNAAEIGAVNLATWPELEKPFDLLGKVFNLCWEGGWGEAGIVAQRLWARSSLIVRTTDQTNKLLPSAQTDTESGWTDTSNMLMANLSSLGESLTTHQLCIACHSERA